MDVGLLVGLVASALCLVLAWRAYRGAAADDEARKRDKDNR
jgi:hypothetical protein